jgi:hypothetical protein
MPLKRPEAIPQIPKTRTKQLSKIKAATPERKKSSIEYIADVFFSYDKSAAKQYYCLRLQTVKEFAVLSYELAVNVQGHQKKIDVSIAGLNIKQEYYVQVKTAVVDLLFEDLYGEYTISIMKQDGSINCFDIEFNIFNRTITIVKSYLLKKKNNRVFCDLRVANHLFTFSEEKER